MDRTATPPTSAAPGPLVHAKVRALPLVCAVSGPRASRRPVGERGAEDAGTPLIEPLTPRERQVLGYVCDGDSNGEIALHLGVGVATVKYHLYQIFGKLGVSRRTRAVAMAVHLKIVTPAWLPTSPRG